MPVVYRLCSSRYPASSGDGALQFGGRWNPVGIPAVYAGASRALCILERLVHLVRLPADEAFTPINIPPRARTAAVKIASLPPNWSAPELIEETQSIGAELLLRQQFAVLKVPSVIVPGEWCYVLNPLHRDFRLFRFGEPVPFHYDRRLRTS